MNKKNNSRSSKMLVVLAIISLIVGMLLTGISIARESARETEARAEMQQIKMAVTQYKSTFKGFPSTLQTFTSFDKNTGQATTEWATMMEYIDGRSNARKQAFIKGKSIAETPWGGSYNYICH